ncbi:FecR family protein [Paraflavitalea speifideaquila]|uniref:FecR family protein n=1 Tax=Paraflavitalea speifideaquila TaxID=3076558 RepID=UPI0028E26924|nr:FecR family protein [Paraflavitalea speifideiaquila]
MLDKELLRKYLDGQCTDEEKLHVNKYLASHQEEIPALEALLNSAWDKSRHNAVSEEETIKHLHRLRSRLYPQAGRVVPMQQGKRRYLRYAAAVAVLAILVPVLFWQKPSTRQVAANLTWDSIINKSTSSLHIVLPDNSTAWVSPNSTLHWNMQAVNQRLVRLQGEAFFDVTHHPDQPFIVQTGPIITRVLGTAFNIEAYEKEASLRISLVRGKVAVEKQLPGPLDPVAKKWGNAFAD